MTLPWNFGTGTQPDLNFMQQLQEDLTGIVDTLIFINVKFPPYNAQGDDSTDDTGAIQAAIDAAEDAGGGTVFLPVGIYQHTGLTIDDDCVTLRGATEATFVGAGGTGVQLKYMLSTGDHLTITDCVRAAVHDITFAGGVAPTAGAVIHTNNSGNTSWHRFDHVVMDDCWNGLFLEDTSAIEVIYLDVHPNIGADFGVYWTGTSDVLYLDRCTIRPDTASLTVVGYLIGNGTNTTLAIFSGADNCNVSWLFDDEGIVAPKLITLYNCVAEASTSYGIWINDGASIEITDVYCNINGSRGMWVDGGASNIRVNGGQFNLNQEEGVYISSGAEEVHFDGVAAQDNGQVGLASHANVFVEANTTNFSFIGGRYGGNAIDGTISSDNATYGIQIAVGTSNWYRIIGINSHGNATGGILNGGSGVNKVIANNL